MAEAAVEEGGGHRFALIPTKKWTVDINDSMLYYLPKTSNLIKIQVFKKFDFGLEIKL